MNWRRLPNGNWALEGLRIREIAPKDYELWVAQAELPLGQKPIKSSHFTSLKSAKDWGKRMHLGQG